MVEITHQNGNAIDFFTRNKHSDYPEVVFSSVLSNLLDPHSSLPFPCGLLADILKSCCLPDHCASSCMVKSEYSLGEAGTIDIFVSSELFNLGIEVKIWDSSAKNDDALEVPQLNRYARKIGGKGKPWRLVYLVPTFDSRNCLSQFHQVLSEFPENIYLASWNPSAEAPTSEPTIIAESILEKLENHKSSLGANLMSRWIYQSLIERIPELIEEVADPGRFPTRADLYSINKLRWLYELLFNHAGRCPSSLHTTVGVPFGRGSGKTTVNNNSLYGIRTTTAYFSSATDKASYLPTDMVEIEIVKPIFNRKREEITAFARHKKLAINESHYHINEAGSPEVAVVGIPWDSTFNEDDLVEFESLLRSAVCELTSISKRGENEQENVDWAFC